MTIINYPPIIARLGGAESIEHDGTVAKVTRHGAVLAIPWERIAHLADDGLAVWVAVELERRTKAQKRAKAAPMTVCPRCLSIQAVRDAKLKRRSPGTVFECIECHYEWSET